MKKITIGDVEYTFEFNLAASLYNECTEEIMNIFVEGGMMESAASGGDVEDAMSHLIKSMASIPNKVITLFYAALLEHHGTEYGDGTVRGQKDAYTLIKAYMKEAGVSMYDIMTEMMKLIEEDNFFEMIGLDKMLKEMESPKKSRKSSKAGETSSKKE